MSDPSEEKSPREHLEAIVSRLKEMEHYSRGNIERLGEDWFLLDDTLKLKEEATRLEELLNAQNKVEDLVKVMIEDFEMICNRLEQEEK